MDLLGPKAVKLYERWMASVSYKLYSPSVGNYRYECTNAQCFKAEAWSTVVLASTIPFLTAAEGRGTWNSSNHVILFVICVPLQVSFELLMVVKDCFCFRWSTSSKTFAAVIILRSA